MVTYFLELGFKNALHNGPDEKSFNHHYTLLPCPEGTYSLGSRGCQKCPPGNFIACCLGVFWATLCMHSRIECIGLNFGLHKMWKSGAREKIATRPLSFVSTLHFVQTSHQIKPHVLQLGVYNLLCILDS